MEQAPEEGWYPDPLRIGEKRYWDGRNWTANVYHPIPAGAALPIPGAEQDKIAETGGQGAPQGAAGTTICGQRVLSDLILRMPEMEARAGVKLLNCNAIYIHTEWDSKVIVMADVMAVDTDAVPRRVTINAAVLNSAGQILGQDSELISAKELVWRYPVRFEIDPVTAEPARVRIIAQG